MKRFFVNHRNIVGAIFVLVTMELVWQLVPVNDFYLVLGVWIGGSSMFIYKFD